MREHYRAGLQVIEIKLKLRSLVVRIERRDGDPGVGQHQKGRCERWARRQHKRYRVTVANAQRGDLLRGLIEPALQRTVGEGCPARGPQRGAIDRPAPQQGADGVGAGLHCGKLVTPGRAGSQTA